jgi:hypothetical protein
MVQVATREANNPLVMLARKFNIELKDTPKLSLPGKLVVPSYKRSGNFSILGLGDIVIPGLLLCFVLRFDAYKKNQLYQVIMSASKSDNATENNADHKVKINKTNAQNNLQIHDDNDFKKERMSDRKIIRSKTNLKRYFSYPFFFSAKINDDCFSFNKNRIVNHLNSNNLNTKIDNKNNSYCNSSNKKLSGNHKYSILNFIRFNKLSYFHCSLIGYFVGLITATLSSEIFREAQPALLYLVPFTLLPLLTMAYLKGDLHLMWNEPFSYSTPKYFNV